MIVGSSIIAIDSMVSTFPRTTDAARAQFDSYIERVAALVRKVRLLMLKGGEGWVCKQRSANG